METIRKNGYNLHIIPNKNFKTVSIKLLFWNKIKKEELAYRNMLLDVLLFSSFKYPSLREMAKKRYDLYDLNLYFDNYHRGKVIMSEIKMSVIHDKYTEKGNISKAIEFLFECINNPNIIDNAFNKEAFNICKEALLSDIKQELDNPDLIAYKELKKMIGLDKYIDSIYGSIKDLNKMTPNSLYKYYKGFFKNNNIDIFVIGDIKKDYIESEIDKYFSLKNNSFKYENPYINYKKDYSEKTKTMPYSQSKLYMAASLDKLTEHEAKIVLPIYNAILGNGPSSKLFNNVREKLSFCYSISSSVSRYDGLFIIRSGISKENFENTKIEIYKQLEEMKKGNFTKKSINEAINLINNIIEEINDSQWSIIDYYTNTLYFDAYKAEDVKEKVKKVTKEDIIKVAKKINIDTLFFLKGDRNEEN